MTSFFERLRGEPQEESVMDDIDKACTMSYKNRIIACFTCYIVGYVITFCSFFAIGQILYRPHKFAILYSLGNVIALMSTCFLWGPCSQAKKMFEQTRIIATLVYLSCIVCTIFLCIFKPLAGPIIMLIIIQFVAGVWYNLSYIPFARNAVKKCFASLME